jgi:hypothetical protein
VKKYKEGGAAITYKGQLDNKNEIVGHYKEKHPFSLYYI